MSDREQGAEAEVRVVVPGADPILTAGAARVLLRIVRAAAVRIDEHDDVEQEAA